MIIRLKRFGIWSPARTVRPFAALFLAWLAALSYPPDSLGAAAASEPIRVTGKIEAVYNKGNGLYSYFVAVGPKEKYRVFAHILDPDQARKEKILMDAAQKNQTATITGTLHRDLKEDAIEVEAILVNTP